MRAGNGFRGFIAVVVFWSFSLVLTATPASAVPCDPDNSWFQVSSPDATQYGARAQEILVVNPGSDCELVRSVYIYKNARNWVEVGWYKDGAYASLDKCTDSTSPRILVWAIVDNYVKCKTNTAGLQGGTTYSFAVANYGHDLDYEYWFDTDTTPDQSLGSFATTMVSGYPISSDERRKGSGDSLRAEFAHHESLGGQQQWHSYPVPSYLTSLNGTNGWDVCSWSGNGLIVKAVGSC